MRDLPTIRRGARGRKGSTDEVRVAERSNPQNNTNGRRMK
jgi:hypothetical protein